MNQQSTQNSITDKATRFIDALSSSYVNVYLADIKTKKVEIIKSEGFITKGLDDKTELINYDDACSLYIKNRVYKDDVQSVTQYMKWDTVLKAVKENKYYEFSYRVLEDGEIHYLQGRCKLVNEDSIVCGFQNVDTLIKKEETQNAELQENINKITSLNKSLTEYNNIISNAGLGIWHIFIKDGKAPRMQVNEKMAELLYIQPEKLTEEEIYSSWFDRITPKAIPSVLASVQEMLNGNFSENTYIWNHPVKGDIYVRCGGTAAKLPDGTNVLSGYHSDVTEIATKEQQQKQALQEAKTQAENHNQELEKQLEIVNAVSKSFNVIYYIDLSDFSFIELGVNLKDVKKVVGKIGDAREAFVKVWQVFVYPEFSEKIKDFTNLYTLNERLKNKKWISCQFKGPLNGWAEGIFIAANRNKDGDCDHVIWATRNIDESKQKEIAYQEALERATREAKSANAAKTTFLFNMSHDIRTPMNAIIGYTDLLEKHLTDAEKCRDYIKKIRASSDFLLSLINDVLEMARIESGKTTLDETVFKTGMIQEEIDSVYSELFKKKNINFSRSKEIDTPYIYGDVVKLKEIFLNIVSNAYKYTPEGGSISIKTVELPSEVNGYAHMRTTFTDTGIGMSKEYLPFLFEEFSRERTATDAGIRGTGLGMPIVKKLIDMMGGTISVDSKLGKGTTFIIDIYHRIGKEPVKTPELTKIPCETNFTGKRILLAEDNDLNAEIAIEILKEFGMEIDRAADGVICVDMFQKAPENYYNLILMDIQMPNMDGYKATRIIRSINNKSKNQIPIIAMTANAFEEDKKNALAAGMNAHLAKPIVVTELLKTIGEFIK